MNAKPAAQPKIVRGETQPLMLLFLLGSILGLALIAYNLAFIKAFESQAFLLLGAEAAAADALVKDLQSDLAFIFLVAGSIGVLISLFFIYLQRWLPFARIAAVFYFLISFALFYGLNQGPSTEQFIFWGMVGLFPLNIFTLLSFEGTFVRLFNVHLTKKYAFLGSLSFSLLALLFLLFLTISQPYFAFVQYWIDHLVYGAALAFGSAALLLVLLTFFFPVLAKVQVDIKEVRDKNQFFRLLDQPLNPDPQTSDDKEDHIVHLTSLAFFIFTSFLVAVFFNFFFLNVIGFHHLELNENSVELRQQELEGFLIIFFGIVLILSVLFRTFLYRFLTRRYSLEVGLLILPGALLAFLICILIYPLFNGKGLGTFNLAHQGDYTIYFIMISICKLLLDAIKASLETPFVRLFLLPIDFDRRFDIQIKLEGFISQLALWTGGLLLLFFIQLDLGNWLALVFTFLLLIALIFLVLWVYRMYNQYLTQKLSQEVSTKKSRQRLPERILQEIHEVHPTQIPIYLNLLNILDPVVYRQAILELIDTPKEKPSGPAAGPVQNYHFENIRALIEENNKKIKDWFSNCEEILFKHLDKSLHAYFIKEDFQLRNLMLDPVFRDTVILELRPKTSLEEKINRIQERIENIFKQDASLLRSQWQRDALKKISIESGWTELEVQDAIQNAFLQSFSLIQKDLKRIKKELDRDIRHLSLNIIEQVQNVALIKAANLSILEAIPILSIIKKTRYFAILNNASLIDATLQRLRSSEIRLEKARYSEQLTQHLTGIRQGSFGRSLPQSGNGKASSGPKEFVEQLTYSKIVEERIFGTLLATYSSEALKVKLIQRSFMDTDPAVRYLAVVAASEIQNPDLFQFLIDKLADPSLSNAAFSALLSIGQRQFDALSASLESAFSFPGQEEVIQLRIIQLYGAIGSEKAVTLLVSKLVGSSNQNISSLALTTLGKGGHPIQDKQLRDKNIMPALDEVMDVLVWNLAVSIQLEKKNQTKNPQDAQKRLLEAMEDEIQGNYDEIFSLLALMDNPASIDLIKRSLDNINPEKTEFSLELLDNILKKEENLKVRLIPLLNPFISRSEKLRSLRDYYYTVDIFKLKKTEILMKLIQRNYKWVNTWTKACALSELAARPYYKDPAIFLANMVNPDIILREISFFHLYQRHPDLLDDSLAKIASGSSESATKVESLLEALKVLKEEAPAAQLKYDVSNFLREVPDFEKINGLRLSEIAKIVRIKEIQPGEVIEQYASIEEIDYFVIQQGQVLLETDKIIVKKYGAKSFLNNFLFINQDFKKIRILGKEAGIIYQIPRDEFHVLMSFNDEIPLSIQDYAHEQSRLIRLLEAAKELHRPNGLAFAEISNITEDLEFSEGALIAEINPGKSTDYYLVQKGKVLIKSNRRIVQQLDGEKGFIHPSRIPEILKQDVQLIARTKCALLKVNNGQLEHLKTLLKRVNQLKKIPELRGLNDQTLLEIARHADEKTSQGFLQETLARGEKADSLDYYVIPLKGDLELSYQKNQKTELRTLEPFEILHPLKFLGQSPNNFVLRSKAAYEILRIPKAHFFKLLNNYDQLTFSLLKLQYGNSYYDYARFLRDQPAFQNLNSLQLLEIAKKIESRHFQAGDRVASYASLDELDAYFIQSGKIGLQINRTQIKAFGLNEVLHHHIAIPLRQVSIRVIANQDCNLYVIQRTDMEHFGEKYALSWKSIQPDYILDPEFFNDGEEPGNDLLNL